MTPRQLMDFCIWAKANCDPDVTHHRHKYVQAKWDYRKFLRSNKTPVQS
jgi:hypothetical protein